MTSSSLRVNKGYFVRDVGRLLTRLSATAYTLPKSIQRSIACYSNASFQKSVVSRPISMSILNTSDVKKSFSTFIKNTGRTAPRSVRLCTPIALAVHCVKQEKRWEWLKPSSIWLKSRISGLIANRICSDGLQNVVSIQAQCRPSNGPVSRHSYYVSRATYPSIAVVL